MNLAIHLLIGSAILSIFPLGAEEMNLSSEHHRERIAEAHGNRGPASYHPPSIQARIEAKEKEKKKAEEASASDSLATKAREQDTSSTGESSKKQDHRQNEE